MIFNLLQDFAAVLNATPAEHARRRILKLQDEAIRRDLHFIARHPTTLFQCLWNTCWWYDWPEAAAHYDPPEGGWPVEGPPWVRSSPKLCELLERWRSQAEAARPGFRWVRMLRPPPYPIGGGMRQVLRGHDRGGVAAAVSPDGSLIISGGQDRTVRFWDAVRSVEIGCFRGHSDAVWSVAFSADGQLAASASADRTIRVFDVALARGGDVDPVRVLTGHSESVLRIQFLHGSRRIPRV